MNTGGNHSPTVSARPFFLSLGFFLPRRFFSHGVFLTVAVLCRPSLLPSRPLSRSCCPAGASTDHAVAVLLSQGAGGLRSPAARSGLPTIYFVLLRRTRILRAPSATLVRGWTSPRPPGHQGQRHLPVRHFRPRPAAGLQFFDRPGAFLGL